MIRKQDDETVKILYMKEKFYAQEQLKLYDMAEQTALELLQIDPANPEFKFNLTKNLLNKGEVWRGLIEYLRARSIIEYELSF